ncbi:MAG: PDZ domain-containing protein [Myxococcales bacterium]|nr:PDZ domain-containing protein [Myxococcales bacterium]MCB9694921.1 PDZ domain-containing protein [Alphaproteobacteria bacterium]
MKRRGSVLVVGLVVLGLAWWLWPATDDAGVHEADSVARRVRRTVIETDRTEPEVRSEALQAALDVCAACADGSRTGTICGACTGTPEPEPVPEEPEPQTVELVVDVVNEDGRSEERANIVVGACPVMGRDGNAFQVVSGFECTVQAYRQEGALWIPSPVVRVMADEGYAQVELPRARMGGLGISFRPHDDGVVVASVMPGTPAHDLGLQHGDVITHVDGVPASSLSREEFVRAMTGPVGTEVDFTVRMQDETGTTTQQKSIRRAYLEGS